MSTPENYLLTIGARNDRMRAQAKPLEKQLRDLDTEYQAASRRPITDVVSPGRGRHSPRPVPDVLPHDFPVSGVAVLDLVLGPGVGLLQQSLNVAEVESHGRYSPGFSLDVEAAR
jgi:hypothetical protein